MPLAALASSAVQRLATSTSALTTLRRCQLTCLQSRWTPQLLKAFEDATDALGPAAAPAAVLEYMGPAAADLTRDAVAAHLQKHRSG